MAHIAGLVAAGVHPSPVPHAHFVTFTTTKTMRGARGGNILCRKEFASRIDKAIFPGIQGGPIPQIMAGKALTFRLAMTEEFRNYGRRTVENAARFASVLMSRGFSLVSGGTDNHLMLVDLRSKGLTGREAEELLHAAGITVNMNLIPFDPEKPTVTSGIRIGLAGATSRGFTSADAEETARIACDLLEKKTAGGPSYRERVLRLCLDHPVYMTREELAASPFFTRDLL